MTPRKRREALVGFGFIGKSALDALVCLELIRAPYGSARDGSREHPVARFG